jgi:hypothetical protein
VARCSLPGGIPERIVRADIRVMNAAEPQTRALTRILHDCARLEDDGGPTGVARLRHAIGEELSRLLLSALAGDHRRAGLGAV